jgi:hypothetical protein
MPRVGWHRRWIKLYPIECLEGSIRYQLEADERGVWYDLLNLAAICAEPGVISDRDGRPYPHQFIASRLNISIDLLERTLKKCNEEGRISENTSGIHITNWKAYQSEYERQKVYRERAKQHKAVDPMLGERQARLGIEYKERRKELGRELTTDERDKLVAKIDRELEKKYGRKVEDALSGEDVDG